MRARFSRRSAASALRAGPLVEHLATSLLDGLRGGRSRRRARGSAASGRPAGAARGLRLGRRGRRASLSRPPRPRRSPAEPALAPGGLAAPSPFVVAIAWVTSLVVPAAVRSSSRTPLMQKPPPVSRRGPWCSVRSLRLALRPPIPRLLPGAANKAEKAKKGEENGPHGYRLAVGLELVEGHVHAAAIARHDDGDGAALLPVREAHAAWRLLRSSPHHAPSGRSVAGIERPSTRDTDTRGRVLITCGALTWAAAQRAGIRHAEPRSASERRVR